jgi:hypothetical protein
VTIALIYVLTIGLLPNTSSCIPVYTLEDLTSHHLQLSYSYGVYRKQHIETVFWFYHVWSDTVLESSHRHSQYLYLMAFLSLHDGKENTMGNDF